MNESKISVRYSRALFQSALDKKILDKVSNDMQYLAEVCRMPEFREFLHSPIVGPEIKSETFHDIFAKDVEEITMSLIDLVIRNGRELYLPAIARVFNTNTLKHKGITECALTTAVKVSPALRDKISAVISSTMGTKIKMEEKISSDILGGFILRIDDQYIDASVTSKLRKIKKELTGKNIS